MIGKGKKDGKDVYLDYGFTQDPDFTELYMAFPILGAVHPAGIAPPDNEHPMPHYNKSGQISVFVGDYLL